jgi:branched-chain amino acid transport system permease protein
LSAGLLLQVVVAGLAAGALYGLIGAAYSLVYRMTGVLNFAHGEMVLLAMFAFLLAIAGGAQAAVTAAPTWQLLLALGFAVVVTVAAALALWRFGIQPFTSRGSVVGWIAATAAAGLLVRSALALVFPAEAYSAPDMLPLGQAIVALPGGGALRVRDVEVLVIAAAVALVFDRWLSRSRTGRAMRAAAEAPQAARLVGISPQRLALLAFAVGGVLVAVAAVLVAPSRPISIGLGVLLGLKGAAAAVTGRLGSARGAIIAGLCIGVAEALVGNISTPALSIGSLHLAGIALDPLRDLLALTLLVALLALAPGLLGGAEEALD